MGDGEGRGEERRGELRERRASRSAGVVGNSLFRSVSS